MQRLRMVLAAALMVGAPMTALAPSAWATVYHVGYTSWHGCGQLFRDVYDHKPNSVLMGACGSGLVGVFKVYENGGNLYACSTKNQYIAEDADLYSGTTTYMGWTSGPCNHVSKSPFGGG